MTSTGACGAVDAVSGGKLNNLPPGERIMKKAFAVFAAALTLATVLATAVEARGRSGSHRVGGTNSHGKGSHYVGGR